MRHRFNGMNQVAGGFLGDLGSIDFWRDQGRRESRGKITYATGKFYTGRLEGSINTKDRMNIVCLVRSTSQRSTTFVDQLATSACLSLLISMAITRRSTHRNRNRESCGIPGGWSATLPLPARTANDGKVRVARHPAAICKGSIHEATIPSPVDVS